MRPPAVLPDHDVSVEEATFTWSCSCGQRGEWTEAPDDMPYATALLVLEARGWLHKTLDPEPTDSHPKVGTLAGYHWHRERGLPPCETCRIAYNAYHRRWKREQTARRRGRDD